MVAVVLLPVLVLAVFWFSGSRAFVVTTPSMGETLPVGTLVGVGEQAQYAEGEVISFTIDGRVYTHRIVEVEAGSFRTRGDLNDGPDPWLVEPAQVIGAVQWHLFGVGWLLLALPWLLLGGLLIEAVVRVRWRRPAAEGAHRRRVSAQWRAITRISGWSLTLALIGLFIRPWMNAVLIGYTAAGGGVLMHVVSTGLLPISLNGTRIVSGEDAVVHLTEATSEGVYRLTPLPALEWWQFVLVAAFCLAPVLFGLRARFAVASSEAEAPSRGRGRSRLKRLVPAFPLVIVAVITVSLVLNVATQAAFTATVKNSNDVLGTSQAFTCRQAASQITSPAPYFGWALGNTGIPSGNTLVEADVTSAGNFGEWATTPTLATAPGCIRDIPAAAVRFSTTSQQCLSFNGPSGTNNSTNFPAPSSYSIQVWFRAQPGSTGGKLIGFRDRSGSTWGNSGDRMLYLTPGGVLFFGAQTSSTGRATIGDKNLNLMDGRWHHAVATFTGGNMIMYVDNVKQVRTNIGSTTYNYNGRWQVGCGKLTSWPTGATSPTNMNGIDFFTGDIQYAAAYQGVLTDAQVKVLYESGKSRPLP